MGVQIRLLSHDSNLALFCHKDPGKIHLISCYSMLMSGSFGFSRFLHVFVSESDAQVSWICLRSLGMYAQLHRNWFVYLQNLIDFLCVVDHGANLHQLGYGAPITMVVDPLVALNPAAPPFGGNSRSRAGPQGGCGLDTSPAEEKDGEDRPCRSRQ